MVLRSSLLARSKCSVASLLWTSTQLTSSLCFVGQDEQVVHILLGAADNVSDVHVGHQPVCIETLETRAGRTLASSKTLISNISSRVDPREVLISYRSLKVSGRLLTHGFQDGQGVVVGVVVVLGLHHLQKAD